MENIRKLEGVIAGWFKNVPHLPPTGQKWLAQNAWWLVMVWVILGVFGIVSLLMVTFFASAFLTGFGPVGAVVGGLAFVAVTIALLFAIVNVVLAAIAISPLKLMQKRGWMLLFVVALLNVTADVIAFLLDLNLFALIWNLLFIGVGTYFLFEIRGYFDGAKSPKKVAAKQKKTE